MAIDEAGKDGLGPQIDHARAHGLEVGTDRLDPVALDQDVLSRLDRSGEGVHEAPGAHEDEGGGCLLLGGSGNDARRRQEHHSGGGGTASHKV